MATHHYKEHEIICTHDEGAAPSLIIDGNPMRVGQMQDGSFFLHEKAFDWHPDLLSLATASLDAQIKVRKDHRDLTDDERQRFVAAVKHLKSTGIVDEFAQIHAHHFNMGIHISSHFLPWHREMLHRFEKVLQDFDSSVTIPYWDSTSDGSISGSLWNNDFMGQFNAAWNLRRRLGRSSLSTQQEVDENQTRDTYSAFWPELENPIHNRPHNWVSGVMASAASPGDPVFYLHHCWIDLLWAKWQSTHPNAEFTASRSGLGLNDPLMEWSDRKPADVLDWRSLGYTYDVLG